MEKPFQLTFFLQMNTCLNFFFFAHCTLSIGGMFLAPRILFDDYFLFTFFFKGRYVYTCEQVLIFYIICIPMYVSIHTVICIIPASRRHSTRRTLCAARVATCRSFSFLRTFIYTWGYTLGFTYIPTLHVL